MIIEHLVIKLINYDKMYIDGYQARISVWWEFYMIRYAFIVFRIFLMSLMDFHGCKSILINQKHPETHHLELLHQGDGDH